MTSGAFPPVLYVVAPAEVGGLERVVSALARGMYRREHPVHVLAIVDVGCGDHPLVRELRDAGVPTTSVEIPHRAYRLERRAVERLMRETRAGLVHTHGTRVDVVDAPVARELGVATVSTLHGFTGGGLKNRVYEWLQVRAVRQCDAVIAVSRSMTGRLRWRGVPPRRLHVVPNAWAPTGSPLPRVEARAALGVAAEGFRIGWVGRLTPEKGADVLLDALMRVRDLPIAASIVGSGPRRSALQARAKAGGIASRLVWHDTVPDAGRLMAAFDLFALTSRTEGTPIALFEAMAARTPVLATAVGGVPDVVTPNEAVLALSGDAAGIAAGIRSVYSNPEAARVRAVAAATRLAEHFAVDPWLDAHERLYRSVVRGSQTSPGP